MGITENVDGVGPADFRILAAISLTVKSLTSGSCLAYDVTGCVEERPFSLSKLAKLMVTLFSLLFWVSLRYALPSKGVFSPC